MSSAHHVASSLAPSPARRPEIEDVVQVDIGQKRRDHRSLPVPPLARRDDPVFQDTRFEPFTDQADDARVADPMLDEADETVLAYRVEEPGNIGVHNVVHLSAVDPDMERVQRIVLAAARAESIAEPEEFLLVDRIQQRSGGPLDNLVLKGGDCQRTLPPIGLRNVPTPRGLRPIGSPMDPIAQIFDPAIEIGFVPATSPRRRPQPRPASARKTRYGALPS